MTIKIAERLTGLRKENGLSQEELAERLGVTRQAVSKWERAESTPDVDNLVALAQLYHITLDELVGMSAAEAPAQAAFAPEPAAQEAPLPGGSAPDQTQEEPPRKGNQCLFPVMVVLVYLLLGFCLDLWHPGWLIFLTIPLYYLPESEWSTLRLMSNPVMVTIIYLLLGFYLDLWHPGWLIFFAIPIINAIIR